MAFPLSLEESFINVFTVSNLNYKDHKPAFVNDINNPVITNTNPMKSIIAFHFGSRRVRQIFSKIIHFPFNSPQVSLGKPFHALQNGWPELNRISH